MCWITIETQECTQCSSRRVQQLSELSQSAARACYSAECVQIHAVHVNKQLVCMACTRSNNTNGHGQETPREGQSTEISGQASALPISGADTGPRSYTPGGQDRGHSVPRGEGSSSIARPSAISGPSHRPNTSTSTTSSGISHSHTQSTGSTRSTAEFYIPDDDEAGDISLTVSRSTQIRQSIRDREREIREAQEKEGSS